MLAREYSGCAAGEIRGDTALRRQLEQILPVWASHTYAYINSVCMCVYSACVCACMCMCVCGSSPTISTGIFFFTYESTQLCPKK